jgi:outer membrane protein
MSRAFATFLVIAVSWVRPALAIDPFGTSRQVPLTPASPVLGGSGNVDPCSFGELGAPLRLLEAVERSLCRNPKTHEAWANVQARAAAVGASWAAYLPSATGTWQDLRDYSAVKVKDIPALSTSSKAVVQTTAISLGWVLYDFGHREATLDNARQMLAAAQADLDANLQQAFLQAAKDYFAAQAAQSSWEATQEIVKATGESEEAAHVRVDKGVAAVSDQLQAQTAYAQAVLNRVKAEADLKTKLGALAIDMGIDPDCAIQLPEAGEDAQADAGFTQSAHDLIEEAKRTHPSIVVAERQLAAAVANEQIVRAQGLPSISLSAKTTRSDQPASPGLGAPPLSALNRDSYFGLQVQVPLFEGFGREYQVQQARAQTEAQRGHLTDVEQQVAQDVWNSYQTLKADTDNLRNTETVLSSAQHAFDVSQQRYLGGAANILEVLNVQTTLANAQQQQIQALSDWRTARLQFAASLGKLGLWSIQDQAQ